MMVRFGLLGKVLGHSWSPQIHELFFRETGLAGSYKLVEVPEDKVKGFIQQAGERFDGLNVTIPYKVIALQQVKKLSREAASIGAVNTLKYVSESIEGFNTDYIGFSRMLKHYGVNPEGKDIILLGSGGAARAVLQVLLDHHPARLSVIVRNVQKGTRDLGDFKKKYSGLFITDYQHLQELPPHDLIVNTTPVGMYPHMGVSPVPEVIMKKTKEAAVDIIYNPVVTEFMKMARESGCFACNGLYMLVAQALASEEIWLNRPVPPELVSLIAKKMEEMFHA
jgi:shikimate dehydrogenase